MAINTNTAHIGNYLINTVFGTTAPAASNGISLVQLCHGEFPGATSSTLSLTNILNGAALNSGTVFNGTNWSVPSEGVSVLASPVSCLIKSSGLPAGAVISFIRLLNSTGTDPIFDVPVDIAKGADNAVLSKIAGIVAGEQITIKDLRIKIATKGDFSFNNALASYLLRSIIGNPNLNIGYGGALMFGHGFVLNTSGSPTAAPLIMDIYDGATIPESANLEPTGTLLWRKQISDASATMPNIFNVSGTSVTLSSPVSANAIASGTPKYLRVYKNAISTADTTYPKLVLQMPIGSGVGYASIDRTTIVSGQSVSVNETSFVIQP